MIQKSRNLDLPIRIPPTTQEVHRNFPVSHWEQLAGEPERIVYTTSAQITESENHKRSRNGIFDSGGSFYTSKRSFTKPSKITFVGTETFGGKPDRIIRYSGPIFPYDLQTMVNDMATFASRSKDLSDLDPIGATAISRCSPVSPVDTLGQGLLENYHDGLPSLPGIRSWKRRLGVIKAAGNEFLNVVFGWDPLVSEVRSFGSTVRDSRDILKQYHKNQGKNVHREFHFPISNSEATSIISTKAHAVLGTGLSGSGDTLDWHTDNLGTVTRTVFQSETQWFSGSFTYAVPSQSDSWHRMLGYGTDADKLFGIALSPELLWNIAPWSWAVDWFSNAGDVMTNLSNFAGAGQIMRYGYMMETKVTTVRYTMDRSSFFIGDREIPAPFFEFSFISKVRRPADPYGFGVSLGDLSPLQIAIAAAVGISLL